MSNTLYFGIKIPIAMSNTLYFGITGFTLISLFKQSSNFIQNNCIKIPIAMSNTFYFGINIPIATSNTLYFGIKIPIAMSNTFYFELHIILLSITMKNHFLSEFQICGTFVISIKSSSVIIIHMVSRKCNS